MESMKLNEWGLLIILSVFWGGSFFFVEIALRDFQPFTLVFLRISIAAMILTGFVYLSGKRLPRSFNTWQGYFLMGCIFLGLIIIDGRALKWMRRIIWSRAAAANNAEGPK